jgi:hypothetical protein
MRSFFTLVAVIACAVSCGSAIGQESSPPAEEHTSVSPDKKSENAGGDRPKHVKPATNEKATAADCPKAADWARAFYAEHYFFYAGEPDPILQFTTPEFGALLKKEWAYSKGEVGHLDYDPWLGAQDGEIGKPVRFSVESESPDTAVVSMSYPYVLDPKNPPERHTAHLVLRKREHECWHLADFITPKGESLSYVYSAAQP